MEEKELSEQSMEMSMEGFEDFKDAKKNSPCNDRP
jgi:hypothetical protein